jgi:hypothetical protein
MVELNQHVEFGIIIGVVVIAAMAFHQDSVIPVGVGILGGLAMPSAVNAVQSAISGDSSDTPPEGA